MFAAVLAIGAGWGRPLESGVFVVVAACIYRFSGYPGLVGMAAVVVALGSSSVADLKSAGTVLRWLALFLLAFVPVASRPRLLDWRSAALPVAGAFVAWCALSTAWSADPAVTLGRTTALALVLWIGLVAAPAALRDADARRRGLQALLVVGVAGTLAALAVAAFAPATGRYQGPLNGWLENSNTMGIWAAALAPSIFVVRPWPVRALLGAPFAAVIVLSQARSALLVVVVLGAAWLALSRPRLVAVGVVAAVVGTVGALTVAPESVVDSTPLSKFDKPGGPLIVATGARSEAWEVSLDLSARAPLEGVGFGAAQHVFELRSTQNQFQYFQGGNPNNAYLQALLEIGVVGLFGFLVLLYVLLAGVWRERGDATRTAWAAVGSVLLLSGIVESVLFSAGGPYAMLAWMGLGVASAELTRPIAWRSLAEKAAARSPVPPARLAALLPIAASLVLITGLWGRAYRGVLHPPPDAHAASHDGLVSTQERTSLERARSIIPPGSRYHLFVPPHAADDRYRLAGATGLYLYDKLPVDELRNASWLLAYRASDPGSGLRIHRRYELGSGFSLFRLAPARQRSAPPE